LLFSILYEVKKGLFVNLVHITDKKGFDILKKDVLFRSKMKLSEMFLSF